MTIRNWLKRQLTIKNTAKSQHRRRKRLRFENLEARNLMAFLQVTGDTDGSIYATDRNGELHWYKDRHRDGSGIVGGVATSFDGANQGAAIATDWQGYKTVFSGGDGILYGIDSVGNLMFHQDSQRDGTPMVPRNDLIGTGWGNFRHVFSGGDGVIYAVDAQGNLRWYDDTARNGAGIVNGFPTSFTAPNEGAVIGTGWDQFTDVISTSDGNIYAVEANGAMRWYKDLSRNGTMNFHVNSGTIVNTGFVNYTLFAGGVSPLGEQLIYATQDTSGELFVFKSNEVVGAPVFANGGNGWLILQGLKLGVVEGYSLHQSITPGEALDFYAAVSDESFQVEYLRLNNSFDAQGRPIDGQYGQVMYVDPVVYPGIMRDEPLDGYRGAGWEVQVGGGTRPGDFRLTDTSLWKSGVYAAHLTTNEGREAYIAFVVRPAVTAKHANYAMIVNTNTWNAYNGWGGLSQYSLGYDAAPLSLGNVPLSFRRPNADASPIGSSHLLQGEMWVQSWMEAEGYQLDYYTDYDLHQGVNGINFTAGGVLRYDAVILSTHPEYYSVAAKSHLQAYVDGNALRGGSLIYLGGNGVFQAVYYNDADPTLMEVRHYGRTRRENWFRNLSTNPLTPGERGERHLLGVASQWDPGTGPDGSGPFRVTEAGVNHPFFDGTVITFDGVDLVVGEHQGPNGFASGWETDQATDSNQGALPFPLSESFLGNGGSPNPRPNIQILAQGKVLHRDQIALVDYQEGSDMTYYNTHPMGVGGGFVFSVGSITFGGSLLVDFNLQRIVRNALDTAVEINKPVITLGGPTSYVENAAPLLFAQTSTLTDPNSLNFDQGSLIVSMALGDIVNDRLAIRHVGNGAGQIGLLGNTVQYGGVPIGFWSGGNAAPLFVTLNANSTLAATRALLRNVTFASQSESPQAGDRIVHVRLADGDGAVENVDRTLTVVSVNDKPVASQFGGGISYTENAISTQLSNTVMIADADSENLDQGSLVVRLTANAQNSDRFFLGSDALISTNVMGQVLYGGVAVGTLSGGIGPAPLTIRFLGTSSPAIATELARHVYYANLSENPFPNPRTVTLTVNDGDGGTSLAVTKQIVVRPVNDRPVLGGIGAVALNYLNNGGSIAVSSAATLSDVDNPTLLNGKLTVRFLAGLNTSNRIEIGGTLFRLGLSNEIFRRDNLTGLETQIGTLNANGGVGFTKFEVTFNALATPIMVQQLIRAIRFRTVGNIVNTQRHLSFVVADGSGSVSDAQIVNINII